MQQGGSTLVPTAQAYGNLAEGLAKKYGDRIIYELGNEWDNSSASQYMDVQTYATYLIEASNRIRKVVPNATIISGGVTPYNGPVDLITQLRDMKALDNIDMVGYHPYNDAQGPTGDVFDAIDQIYAATGKPVALTEFGWSTFKGNGGVTEQQQATYVSETFEQMRRRERPIGIATYYDLIDDGSDPTQREQNFGLLRADLTPKEALATMREEVVLFDNTK